MMERAFLEEIVDMALKEDLSHGDPTSSLLPDINIEAYIRVERDGILAGIEIAELVFKRVDPDTEFEALFKDGSPIKKGDVIAKVRGRASSILKAERTALNFLQHLSGIATLTRKFVDAVEGTGAKIADTRKTTPLIRLLEKYAVRMGGGINHRLSLGSGILIKDNHIAVMKKSGKSLEETVKLAREKNPLNLKVEVEVENLSEFEEALRGGADVIMLDNMSIEDMREAVKRAKGKALLELIEKLEELLK